MTALVSAERVSVRASGRLILDTVSVDARAGEVLVILGPNGAGKSTLLGVLAGERPIDGGRRTLLGRDVEAWSRGERARRRALLEQHATLDAPMRALDVVKLGRAPYAPSAEDEPIATAALDAVAMRHAQDRQYTTLSGGEQQRVQLARALAQLWGVPACALLLDEPVSALDVAVQHEVLRRARARSRQGAAVVVTLHDLNLAAAYADRVVLLSGGRVIATGAPDEVLTPTLVEAVFGLPVTALRDPERDITWIVPRVRPRKDEAHGAA